MIIKTEKECSRRISQKTQQSNSCAEKSTTQIKIYTEKQSSRDNKKGAVRKYHICIVVVIGKN